MITQCFSDTRGRVSLTDSPIAKCMQARRRFPRLATYEPARSPAARVGGCCTYGQGRAGLLPLPAWPKAATPATPSGRLAVARGKHGAAKVSIPTIPDLSIYTVIALQRERMPALARFRQNIVEDPHQPVRGCGQMGFQIANAEYSPQAERA